jgi:malonyl-CoA/methylmalonyl-CoA synthetase
MTGSKWAVHLPPELDPAEVQLLAEPNLTRRWTARWRERGDAPMLCDVDGRWLTAAEIEEHTRHAAQRLRATGLEPLDRLLIVASSSAEFVIAYIAALRAGLTVVPINPAYTRSEVARIVRACTPAAAAVDSDERSGWVREAAEPGLIVFGTSLDLAEGSEIDLDNADAGDTAILVFTSGTTGQPKGVPLSHANLLSSATAVNLAWRWAPDDRLLLTLPLFHVHGLGVGLNGTLCAGAAAVLRARFDAADVAENCRRGATLFFGVPAMYQRLASTGGAEALGALRLIVSGSAPLSADLAREIAAAAGQIPLERYGMSETVMLAGNPYEGERRPGTVGFPFPGVELRLADNAEVQVRGPNVIDRYLDQPEATAEAFTDDGWFRTGDLGELDADGYLRLVGRSKELIISGGYNVYPREVEEALATHPAVREAAVIGRPSERWGEEVTAVVVVAGGLTEDELRDFASKRLAPYKVPKRIEFATELPRNALGKVVRGKL